MGTSAAPEKRTVKPLRRWHRWYQWFRQWFRPLRRSLLALMLAGTILASSQADFRPSAIDLAIAPHRYSIVAWELAHLPDRWLRKLGDLWPGRGELTQEEKVAQVREFFDLGRQQRQLERQLRRVELGRPGQAGGSASETQPLPSPTVLAAEVERIKERRQTLLPVVEATVEDAITRALEDEGIIASWGGVFPPVDTVFSSPPNLLVLSPRERIYQQQATLLRPGLSDRVKEEIEGQALQSANLSAVVERTGGLSVYPSVVLDTYGLRFAVETVAHEWVHSWLFFRPLGRSFQSSPELLTLNETAATIAGDELGDRAFATITGQPTPPHRFSTDVPGETPAVAPGGFDFTAEMRQTRRRAEELLAQGDIEGAEAYMEERRRRFVANGYDIRKINQAYFAFHGSYATGPGSVSPIGEQLGELRRNSDSLSHFLETVAQFDSYGEFLGYLEGVGAEKRK